MEAQDLASIFDIKISAPASTVARALGIDAACEHLERQHGEGQANLPGFNIAVAAEVVQGYLKSESVKAMASRLMAGAGTRAALNQASAAAGLDAENLLTLWTQQLGAPTAIRRAHGKATAKSPDLISAPGQDEAAGIAPEKASSGKTALVDHVLLGLVRLKRVFTENLGKAELAAIAAGIIVGLTINARLTQSPEELRSQMSLEGAFTASPDAPGDEIRRLEDEGFAPLLQPPGEPGLDAQE